MDSLICQMGMAATSEVHGRMQLTGMRHADWRAHNENVGGGTEGRGSWETRFSSGFCFQHLFNLKHIAAPLSEPFRLQTPVRPH